MKDIPINKTNQGMNLDLLFISSSPLATEQFLPLQ